MSDQTTTDPAEIRQAVRDELDSMLPVDWERDFNGRVVIDAAVKVVCERLAETAGREQVARQEIERLGNLLTRATDEIDAIRDALDPFGVFDSHGEPANVTLVEAAGLLVSEWQAVREALSGVDFGDHAGCTLVEKTGMVRGNLDNLRAENARLNARADEYFHREREMGEKLREQSEALARKDAEIAGLKTTVQLRDDDIGMRKAAITRIRMAMKAPDNWGTEAHAGKLAFDNEHLRLDNDHLRGELEDLRQYKRDHFGVVCKNGHHTRNADVLGDPNDEDWQCAHCVARAALSGGDQ